MGAYVPNDLLLTVPQPDPQQHLRLVRNAFFSWLGSFPFLVFQPPLTGSMESSLLLLPPPSSSSPSFPFSPLLPPSSPYRQKFSRVPAQASVLLTISFPCWLSLTQANSHLCATQRRAVLLVLSMFPPP